MYIAGKSDKHDAKTHKTETTYLIR
jgi:hypothetical protein